MTREEYERLLQSDYWKGYSYSLIKERNFTCEECGRRFENERNKLQVHHLVYRDVNPWSYKPEELIVLCEECHKKRHGIMTNPEPVYDSTDTEENWQQTYHSTRSGSSSYERDPYIYPMEKNNRFSNKRILFGILFLVALFFVISTTFDTSSKKKVYDAQKETVQPVDVDNWDIPEVTTTKTTSRKTTEKKKEIYNNKEVTKTPSSLLTQEEEELNSPVESSEVYGSQSNNVEAAKPKREMSTLELLEKQQHKDVVKQAKRAGVSAEGSTIEILERIQHADVIKQAKRAGVSSEGSTIEILERIQHADVVKQAKRAGVSTEGSTIEILERIQHADVIKQAKRAGVSTEGSTIEILERIQRKDLEKYSNGY
jgi:predicted mannosyl-3-phosphoglycerate phosphatase (HAD superfamily)